jgi:hypothetical protein
MVKIELLLCVFHSQEVFLISAYGQSFLFFSSFDPYEQFFRNFYFVASLLISASLRMVASMLDVQ